MNDIDAWKQRCELRKNDPRWRATQAAAKSGALLKALTEGKIDFIVATFRKTTNATIEYGQLKGGLLQVTVKYRDGLVGHCNNWFCSSAEVEQIKQAIGV